MNRRASQRAKVDLLINRFLDGHPYMCRMTDISPTGMRLIPLLEPRVAPRFMGLPFQLPGVDLVLTASGEAVSTARAPASEANDAATESGTGIRFTSLPADCESAIRRFVASA